MSRASLALLSLLVLACDAQSDSCPNRRIPNWGQLPQFDHCVLEKTWQELARQEAACYYPERSRGEQCTFQFKTGGLGDLVQPNQFHNWVCARFDVCAEEGDEYFCYVYDEQGQSFVPWNTNANLTLCDEGDCTDGWPRFFEFDDVPAVGGFTIVGPRETPVNLGYSVHPAGDVNGDGIGDMVVSSIEVAQSTGAVWVVFGRRSYANATLHVEELGGPDGFRVDGEDLQDLFGFSVAGAGDFNGDGIDDVALGASQNDHGDTNAGAVYVLYGSRNAFPAQVSVTDLDGSNGFRVHGAAGGDRAGSAVSGVGDVNRDGYADLVIGANGYDINGTSGRVYVVFGRSDMPASTDLADFGPDHGFTISSYMETSSLGLDAVSWAGDINGDGYDDVIVGVESGGIKAAVVYGRAGGYGSDLRVDELGSAGFVLTGPTTPFGTGRSVGGAGDVNGDGLQDLVVGAYNSEVDGAVAAGEAFVVFGSTVAPGNGSISLAALAGGGGVEGFVMEGEGEGDRAGWAVGRAGDVDGDGIDDVAVGALRAAGGLGVEGEGASRGAVYVLFGRRGGWGGRVRLTDVDGVRGFKGHGERDGDEAASTVMGGADLNGDGYADLMVGVPKAARDVTEQGEVHVLFGKGRRCPSAPKIAYQD